MAEGTVLLIDGDARRRRKLRSALERRGYAVLAEAGSVPEVVNAVASLRTVPSTVMVGATLGTDASRIARLTKRTWPKAMVIEEMAAAAVPTPVEGGLRSAAGA